MFRVSLNHRNIHLEIMKNKNFILGTLIVGAFCISIMWVALEAILFILLLIFNL